MEETRGVIMNPHRGGAEILAEVVEAHGQMFEDKLTEVLDRHSLKLGQDGVEVLTKILDTDNHEISIVYEVHQNKILVETFGFTLDLTDPSILL